MSAIVAAQTLAELEDIYLHKPKRKTRASVAKERGLEPLAQKLFDQEKFDVDAFAASFIDAGKDVADARLRWMVPATLLRSG